MRFSLTGSLLPGRRARRARFPTCGVVCVAGYSVVWECISTSEFFPKAPKGALRPFSVAALLHYFTWCASEYSVVDRISCHVPHDNTRTSVCQLPFAKKFLLLLLLNRIDSIPASEKAGHCDLRILRLKRIANTAGVRTHRKNERFSLAPELLILLLGNPHIPFMSELKILPELFRKPLPLFALTIIIIL